MPNKLCAVAGAVSLLLQPLQAQNLVPNPSLELGGSQPANWNVFYGSGSWEEFGNTGSRSISIVSPFAWICGIQWRSDEFQLEPGKPYLVNLWGVSSNTLGNHVQAGLGNWTSSGTVDRQISLEANWTAHSFMAVTPTDQLTSYVRLIQCNEAGRLTFDDIEVLPVLPVHQLTASHELGEFESVRPGRYSFQSQYRDSGARLFLANYSRCLAGNTAYFFNYFHAVVNRYVSWNLVGGRSFTYRHEFGGKVFTNAVASIESVSQNGSLLIEFSTNGTSWVLGTNYSPALTGSYTVTNKVAVPASLLPATNLYTRVRVAAGASYYINGYAFDGDLPENTASADGRTLCFAKRVPAQGATLLGLNEDGMQLALELANTNATSRNYSVQWSVQGPAGTLVWSSTNAVAGDVTNTIPLNFSGMGWGVNTLSVEVKDLTTGATNFSGFAIFQENLLRDSSYGSMLSSTTNCAVWWCEGTYKVGRNRLLPTASNAFAELAAARNDDEPVQIVLRPSETLSNVTASISNFGAEDTNNLGYIAATNVEINVVDYVPIITPTDYTCVAGDHPDPLLPWTAPMTFPAGTNQPLWVTVRIPKDAAAGYYTATITLQHTAGSINVPVRLRVFDFTLSDVNHTRTALNVGVDDYWHAMTNSSLRIPTYELYLENLRRHRVSPFKPHNYAPLNYSQVNGSNGISYNFNFTGFDAAMENYYEAFGFNGFRLDGEIVPGSLNGNPRFTPGYNDLYKRFMEPVMTHLRERGWLKPAYSWWIDEPNDTLIQTTVIPGMNAIAAAAPGLTRLETREPKAELFGLVETWVPYTPWLVMSTVPERKAYGENFIWYVSGGPGAPYPMHLVDHPVVNTRMRFWMGEKYGIDGEFYWQAAWWIGTAHAPINPWTNTMAHIFDGSAHGNGNGVLVYPPTKIPPTSPLVAPPINGIRWENFREGTEDREYFWLLNDYLARRELVLGANHPAVVQAKAARENALGVVLSRTYYESDPQKLYAGRKALAEAIEALDDGSPFIARDPVSRAVALGSNIVLRAEAVGWPPPAYQWQHEGTNVPGATNATLALMNFSAVHLGAWHTVASNSVGTATSAVANLAGYWVQTPQIIAFSPGDNRRVGDRTVLEVTVVSSLPVTYRWYLNGVLLAGVTNNAWAITNLPASTAGIYTVTASNAAGLAMSGPIALSVMPAYTIQPPAFTGSWGGAGDGFELSLPVDNRARTVLVSTNLANWSTQSVVNPSGLPQVITDSTATNLPRRFYRVRAN